MSGSFLHQGKSWEAVIEGPGCSFRELLPNEEEGSGAGLAEDQPFLAHAFHVRALCNTCSLNQFSQRAGELVEERVVSVPCFSAGT